MINNKNLSNQENNWLNILLKEDFKGKEILINQINSAEVKKVYEDYFISIQFKPTNMKEKFRTKKRVPIEMLVQRKESLPLQFLLHVINDTVSELEIYAVDSSKVGESIEMEDIVVRIDSLLLD